MILMLLLLVLLLLVVAAAILGASCLTCHRGQTPAFGRLGRSIDSMMREEVIANIDT